MAIKYDLLNVITDEEIKSAIQTIAQEYSKTYENQTLTIVADFSAVFVFVADLIREIPIDIDLQFVNKISNKNSPNKYEILILDIEKNNNFKDKNILIVNGILDNGNSISELYNMVNKQGPASINVLTLIEKDNKNKKLDFEYTSLFKLGRDFLVGYGHTKNESYRGLKGIYKLIETEVSDKDLETNE